MKYDKKMYEYNVNHFMTFGEFLASVHPCVSVCQDFSKWYCELTDDYFEFPMYMNFYDGLANYYKMIKREFYD